VKGLLSLLIAIVVTLWCILVFYFVSKALKGGEEKSYLFWSVRENVKGRLVSISREAEAYGVSWRVRDTLLLWLGSFLLSGTLFILTDNVLLFIAGWFFMGLLPGLIIKIKYQNQRFALLEGLVECLRLLIARIPDQGSFVRSLELTLQGRLEANNKLILQEVMRDITLGNSMETALNNWRKRVNIRKFNHVIDTMLQAHYEGWTRVAVEALDKAVQAMEADVQAIKLAREKSRQRKRKLYFTILTAWSFPLILSLLNSGSENVYLATLPGKLLIFAYVVGTLLVIVKGNEYISLNVDEL